MAKSRAGISQAWGTDILASLALGWLVSLLPGSIPSRKDPQEGPRLVLSPAVTERHQETFSHKTRSSEMRHPPEGVSHSKNNTYSEDVMFSEAVTCLSP